jgi:hypothetical protein
VVYWLLQSLGFNLLSSIWLRVHHREAEDGGQGRSLPFHVMHVVNDAVRQEVRFYYDRDHNGTVSAYEVRPTH